MISRAIFLASFILISFTSFSQNLAASIDFARFKINDTSNYVEFYISIDASTTIFNATKNGKFQNQIKSSIQLSKNDTVRFFEKFIISAPEVTTSTNQFFFNFSKRVFTKNKIYDCEIKLEDNFGKDTSFTINFEVNNNFRPGIINFSDVQLLDSYEKSDEQNDFTKSGYLMNPAISNFYANDKDRIKYYIEIYNTDSLIGKDEPLVIFTTFRNEKGKLLSKVGKYSKKTTAKTVPLLGEISIKNLPSGNFFLIVEARDKENKLKGFTKKFIQRSNSSYDKKMDSIIETNMYVSNFSQKIDAKKINYYLRCLRPIASELEYNSILALVKSEDSTRNRNYFFEFWYKRFRSNAQKEWIKYHKRIKYVDNKFSCFNKPGFYSEMGRVYLKYGAPNQIENEFTAHDRNGGDNPNEYQIWQYYTIGKQRNRIIVFTKTNGGRCNFDLVHSTVDGEYQNQDWLNNTNWRKRLQQNSNPFLRSNQNEEDF